jgi:long-chain acyl-CoA synthetase
MKSPNNLDFLRSNFNSYSSRVAIIWNDNKYSYQYLLDRIEFWELKLNDIKEGSIVGIESDFSPETVSILLALIYKNTILVPLDKFQSSKNIKKYEIAQIDILIKVNSEVNIEIINIERTADKNLLYSSLLEGTVPGIVLFTSGSSGEPKGAVHNLSKLLSKFRIRKESLLTINFLLFDHWGGLNTLFHILSNGGTVVFLESRNPDYVCELICKHKVELLPTSPTFLNMLLLSRAFERHDISSLKIISYGSEPMPESILNRLNLHFPNVKLLQTYGLIELGVMSSKSKDNNSLWVKLGGDGYQTRVIDGLLEIKSDSAMLGYLNLESPYTADGWFKTGDAVEIDGEYFKILGRKSELINVGGEKVYPQEVENVLLTIDNILDVQVFGEKNPFTGNIVCAKIIHDDCDLIELKRVIKSVCKSKLETFKVPVKIIFSQDSIYSDRFKKQRKQ